MAKNENAETHLAVYWDFENIHASLCNLEFGNNWYIKNRTTGQPQVIAIDSIMEFIAALGLVNINKAYADWSSFYKYSPSLQEFSIDLVQLFPRGRHGKNGSDIRMSIDVIEDLSLHQHLDTIVVIGGDSDYIAIAQKVRQRGKTIIGIGVKETTNQYWIKSCNEFKFYSGILVRSSASLDLEESEYDEEEAKDLLVRAIRKIMTKNGSEHAMKSAIKSMMMRLDPAFDEANYGYKKFGDFLSACQDIIEIHPDGKDQLISLKDSKSSHIEFFAQSERHQYEQILKAQGIRLPDPGLLRIGIFETFKLFSEIESFPSYADYRIALKKRLPHHESIKDSDISKIKTILFKSFAFELNRASGCIYLTKEADSPESLYFRSIKFLIKRILENIVEDIDYMQLEKMLADSQESHDLLRIAVDQIERID